MIRPARQLGIQAYIYIHSGVTDSDFGGRRVAVSVEVVPRASLL